MIQASDEDIGDTLNHCSISADTGRSAYPGMTYEQGVEAAIMWLTGNTDNMPISPEDMFTGEE